MISMKSCCHHLLFIFLYTCLSPHVVHKGKQETSVGEAHHDNKTRFDHKNHEIQKAMDQIPRSPKLDRNGPESGTPGHPYGPAGPSQCCLISRFIHGQVCGPYDLFSHVSLSVLNRIENPLIKQL